MVKFVTEQDSEQRLVLIRATMYIFCSRLFLDRYFKFIFAERVKSNIIRFLLNNFIT